MVEGFITNQEKIEFKQIVLQHLKKILELSSIEFHGGYNKTIQGNNSTSYEYVPDTRKGYIQAIENFAMVLLPHFDNEMKDFYKARKERENQLIKELEGEKVGLVWVFNGKEISGIKVSKIYDRSRLELAEELFEQLNLLLKRIDYLNKAVYSEDEEPEVAEVD